MEMEFTGFRFKCAGDLLQADCFSIECGFQPSQASGKLVLMLSFQMKSQDVFAASQGLLSVLRGHSLFLASCSIDSS